MRAVSKRWLRTVAGSFRPRFRATLCTTFQTGTSPVGRRIPIVDGQVVVDGTADVRSSLDLTVPGSYWPTHVSPDLAPYGVELYIEVGVQYSDAEVEYLGLGYFRVQVLGQEDPAKSSTIRLTGQDRMAGIVRAPLLSPRAYEATTTVEDYVADLLADVYPDATATFDDNTGSAQLGRAVVVERDRLGGLRAIANSYGKLFYWSPSGVLQYVTPPDPDRPVARLAGGAGGTLMVTPRELSDDGVINAVVAEGDGTDQQSPAYAVAIDTNPLTGYASRFGPSPDFVQSSLIRTNIQAYNAAVARLRKSSGLAYKLAVTASPRWELEPFDPIVIDQDAMLERHVLSSLTIGLRPGQQMTGNCRQQSVTLLGATP